MPADRAQFNEVFDAHYDAIHRYCLRRLPVDAAGDAACDVFVTAWRRIDQLPAEPLPWLYGVAANVVRNSRRSTMRSERLKIRVSGLGSAADTPEDTVVESAEIQETRAALDSLAHLDREIVLLRTYEELSIAEIATALDLSEAATRKRLDRAIKKVRTHLGRQPVPAHSRARKGGDR